MVSMVQKRKYRGFLVEKNVMKFLEIVIYVINVNNSSNCSLNLEI
jgi:hypothetical protein